MPMFYEADWSLEVSWNHIAGFGLAGVYVEIIYLSKCFWRGYFPFLELPLLIKSYFPTLVEERERPAKAWTLQPYFNYSHGIVIQVAERGFRVRCLGVAL